jgi:hypothetical protein
MKGYHSPRDRTSGPYDVKQQHEHRRIYQHEKERPRARPRCWKQEAGEAAKESERPPDQADHLPQENLPEVLEKRRTAIWHKEGRSQPRKGSVEREAGHPAKS